MIVATRRGFTERGLQSRRAQQGKSFPQRFGDIVFAWRSYALWLAPMPDKPARPARDKQDPPRVAAIACGLATVSKKLPDPHPGSPLISLVNSA